MESKFIGIDLFAGAGGMSVGAIQAGIDVQIAVEIDKYASATYAANHKSTQLFNQDISTFRVNGYLKSQRNDIKVLFGGPPCKGFSTSNQKTRNKVNPSNWLFTEYLRITKEVMPDWVIVENVKGILETEGRFFFDKINSDLRKLGYTTNFAVLNAADFGVPQVRHRVFIVGSLHGIEFEFPKPTSRKLTTVKEALSDLPKLNNGAYFHELDYFTKAQSAYQKKIRLKSRKALNNLVTDNAAFVIKRYKHIPPGGNWEDIPPNLMKNYKDFTRCHSGIYHRLDPNKPSVVIGNYRKNMLIHPFEDRGLSVREAARIQSFPDTFQFYGSIGFQQEQVGNSVPPLLASHIFKQLANLT